MRKARLNKPHASVGPRRLQRLLDEAECRKNLELRLRQAQGRARLIKRLNPIGLKRQYVPGREEEKICTPYMRKVVSRRRAAKKAARRSRQANQ